MGGSGARSITTVRTPAAAKRHAKAPPTGPAPTTQTSASIVVAFATRPK